VIGPTWQVPVLVATKPVDFRKGMDGLAALVKEELRGDPFSGPYSMPNYGQDLVPLRAPHLLGSLRRHRR
jgi:hypothetical protein